MNRYILVLFGLVLAIAAVAPSVVQHAFNNIILAFTPLFQFLGAVAVYALIGYVAWKLLSNLWRK